MAQEGKLNTIPVKGIERAGSYSLQDSGACNEVVGLEVKDGCLVPFEPIRTKADISGYDDVWVHKTAKQNNYIYRNGRTLTWQSEADALAGEHNQKELAELPDGCHHIDFVNNILCYCCKMHVFKDGNYSSAASVSDFGLEMSVGTVPNGIAVMVDKYQAGESIKGPDYSIDNFVNYLKGMDFKQRMTDNFKILSNAVRKGEYINGACLMRYAVRLYDGSYANISEPVFCTSDPHVGYALGKKFDYTNLGIPLRARPVDEANFTEHYLSYSTGVQQQLLSSAFWWEQLPYWDTGGGDTKDFSGKCDGHVKNIIKWFHDKLKDKKPLSEVKLGLLASKDKEQFDIMRNHGYAVKYQLPDYDYWHLSNNIPGFREVIQFNSKRFDRDGYYKFDENGKKLIYDYQATRDGKDGNYYKIDLSGLNAYWGLTWDAYPVQVAPMRMTGTTRSNTVLRSGYYCWVDCMIANVYQNKQANDISEIFDHITVKANNKADYEFSNIYTECDHKTNHKNWFYSSNTNTSNAHYGELGVATWNINSLDGDDTEHKLNFYAVLSRECDTPAFIVRKKIPDELKVLAVSVDIFITEIVDCREDYLDDDIRTMMAARPYKKRSDVVKELAALSGTYYKIHSVPIKELDALDANRLVIPYIERGSLSALEQQETLTEYGQDNYDYETSYVYNSKLHIANMRQTIYNGFETYGGGLGAQMQRQQREGTNLHSHRTPWNRRNGLQEDANTRLSNIADALNTQFNIKAKYSDVQTTCTLVGTVSIKDETLDYDATTVWKRDMCLANAQLVVPSYIYPSASATAASIKGVEIKVKGKYYFFETNIALSLTRETSSNMAYYIGDPIVIEDFSSYKVSREASEGEKYKSLGGGKDVTVERDGNIFKVSKTNNPLVFPYAQTYTVGFGKIIGFCSNTIALSQGQFGTHPLLVFTTEGIFAMQVDTSGVGSYLSNAPLSREVCNNADSIAQTDSGIYFSTEKGLMLLSGSEAVLASEEINGEPEPLPNLSAEYERGDGLKVYGNAITNAQLVQLSGAISQDDFRDYLSASGTHLSYIYVKSKLICYNPKYAYCYLIDVQTNVCTKLNKRIAFDTKNYPSSLYAIVDGYSMHREATSAVFESHKKGRTI